MAFYIWLLSFSLVSSKSTRVVVNTCSFLMICQIIFPCMDVPHSIHSFLSGWAFGLFPLFGNSGKRGKGRPGVIPLNGELGVWPGWAKLRTVAQCGVESVFPRSGHVPFAGHLLMSCWGFDAISAVMCPCLGVLALGPAWDSRSRKRDHKTVSH